MRLYKKSELINKPDDSLWIQFDDAVASIVEFEKIVKKDLNEFLSKRIALAALKVDLIKGAKK
jgi:hypothetical protein